MKPPTVTELRSLAEAFFAMHEGEDRSDELIRCALNRWADQIERKQEHVSHFMRKKEARKEAK